MQHPVSKLALLALLCLISTRVHGARPIQPIFHLANFSHPLVIDNPYLSLPAGRHIVFYEVEGGECAVNDFVVTADTKSDFQGLYAGLSVRAISDRVWLDEDDVAIAPAQRNDLVAAIGETLGEHVHRAAPCIGEPHDLRKRLAQRFFLRPAGHMRRHRIEAGDAALHVHDRQPIGDRTQRALGALQFVAAGIQLQPRRGQGGSQLLDPVFGIRGHRCFPINLQWDDNAQGGEKCG